MQLIEKKREKEWEKLRVGTDPLHLLYVERLFLAISMVPAPDPRDPCLPMYFYLESRNLEEDRRALES